MPSGLASAPRIFRQHFRAGRRQVNPGGSEIQRRVRGHEGQGEELVLHRGPNDLGRSRSELRAGRARHPAEKFFRNTAEKTFIVEPALFQVAIAGAVMPEKADELFVIQRPHRGGGANVPRLGRQSDGLRGTIFQARGRVQEVIRTEPEFLR